LIKIKRLASPRDEVGQVKYLLVDGNSLLYRCHWVNKARNQDSLEFDTYVFLRSLRSYVNLFTPEEVYVAWDKRLQPEKKNFRERSAKEYKQQRSKEEASAVHKCAAVLEDILNSLGYKNIFPAVLEADDVLSWLTTKLDGIKVVVTADKDLLQLVNDSVFVYLPMKKKIVSKKNFEEIIKVPLKGYLYYKAALGDKSDNIEGVPGIGKVKATKLASQVATGQDFECPELLKRNLGLMDLKESYLKEKGEVKCYEKQLQKLQSVKQDIEKFKQYCKKYEYNSFLREL